MAMARCRSRVRAPGFPPPRWKTRHSLASWARADIRVSSDGADDQHRAGRGVRDLVRHRAEQEPPGAGHALVAHDDQVRVAFLGDVEDRVRRVALAREDLDLEAGG